MKHFEARQLLRRADVQEELAEFVKQQQVRQTDLALEELRKVDLKVERAVGYAMITAAYDQLLAQLNHYLDED